MDLLRKKIVILSLGSIINTASGKEEQEDITDFRIRKEILDKLNTIKGLSRVVVIHGLNEKEFLPMLKALEFFIFVYCKTAVSCMASCDGLMDSLPHNLRRKDVILSVGSNEASELLNSDYVTKEDFLSL